MTKGKDNSEQVRIRTEHAEYIRSESQRLGKNFLSTLYWIIDNYRAQQAGRVHPVSIPASNPQVKSTDKEGDKTEKPVEMTDENLLDNVADFL